MHKGYVITRPLITEQTMKDTEKGKYTFSVNLSSHKDLIKSAIEKQFSVNVIGVSTARVKGRTKRVGSRRIEVVNPTWKKATVELKKGQKIDIFTVGK